jgi:hypothetical protein
MNPHFSLKDVDVWVSPSYMTKLCFTESHPTVFTGSKGMPMTLERLRRPETYMSSRVYNYESKTGRGYAFEKLNTQPSCGMPENSTHRRIMQYRFGDLTFVCQYTGQFAFLHQGYTPKSS